MNFASGVLYHTRLIQKVQRRLVRILISRLEKSKYDKNKTPSIPSQGPTLEDRVNSSRHNLHINGNNFRCLDCSGSCSKASVNLNLWLSAPCTPVPYDDSTSHVRIPSWYVVQINNNVPHSSHVLYSIRGIVFCNVCGAYSSSKARLLNAPCRNFCSPFSDRALTKLKSGEKILNGKQGFHPPLGGGLLS